jgi:hypothetical protein
MGLFDVLGSVAKIAVKTVITPIAITSDFIESAGGNEGKSTKRLAESIVDDIEEITND